jgi:hypothetical protein
VSTDEQDMSVKTARGKGCVNTANRDPFVSYAEGLKYANTIDKSTIAERVTEINIDPLSFVTRLTLQNTYIPNHPNN